MNVLQDVHMTTKLPGDTVFRCTPIIKQHVTVIIKDMAISLQVAPTFIDTLGRHAGKSIDMLAPITAFTNSTL